MTGYICGIEPQRSRKYVCCILAICWLLGLVCGIFVFYYADISVLSLMRRTIHSSVSIVGLLSNLLIPFLFSSFAISFSTPWWIFLICFFEAGLLSFVSAGISVAFDSAGWLLRGIMMFCGGIGASALYTLWRRLLIDRNTAGVALLFSFLLLLAYTCDYYVISPFLASLIIN